MGAIVGVGGGLGVLVALGEEILIPGETNSKLGTFIGEFFEGVMLVLPEKLDRVPSGQVSRVGSLL